MRQRVRIIEHKRQPSFGERLEAKVGEIVRRDRSKEPGFSAVSTIERELALTLSHINKARSLHRMLHLNLLHQECYIDTEILQREPRPQQYVDYRLPERDRLRDRLREIERERRHMAVVYQDKLRGLHDHLLLLLNRHAQIQI